MASEILSIGHEVINNKLFSNYNSPNLFSNSNMISLDETNNNYLSNKNIPIYQLIFYFEEFQSNENNTTIPGYIQNIIYSLSLNAPEKLQEIVILNQERILEIYSKNIGDDSIRQILLSLLTIQNEIKNNIDDYDYKQNLKERYFISCINIVDKFLSKYLIKYYDEANESFNEYQNFKEDKNIKKLEFLNKLYDSKFKIKNTFILILKFIKFVDLTYQSKIDDILLRIFQMGNLKILEKIIFSKYGSTNTNLNFTDLYIYEEFFFFFSYFLKICFNKKNCNKEYLMNNFLIDDYEKIYYSQNQTNTLNVKEKEELNSEKNEKTESSEDKKLSCGENISGKIDNLYSCSFNLEEKLNDSTKFFLLNFYFENFEKFFNLVKEIESILLKIKDKEFDNNDINKDLYNSSNLRNCVSSFSYLYFLDFLIVLFDQNKKEFSVKNIFKKENFSKIFFEKLIEDIINYKSNQFIQNKILRVFELLFSEDNIENQNLSRDLTNNKIINFSQVSKILENINFSNYINLER